MNQYNCACRAVPLEVMSSPLPRCPLRERREMVVFDALKPQKRIIKIDRTTIWNQAEPIYCDKHGFTSESILNQATLVSQNLRIEWTGGFLWNNIQC